MQLIPIDDPRLDVQGALSTEHQPSGAVVLRRLPEGVLHELTPDVDFMVQSPSGVRLRFATDATMIGLDFLPTVIQFKGEEPRPAVIDLVVENQVVDSASTTDGNRVVIDRADRTDIDFDVGDEVSLVLTEGGGGMRTAEVWLPSASLGEFTGIRVPNGAKVEAAPTDRRRRWVHHGSSISHGMEAHGPARTWPAVAARLADVNLTNLGFAGQCHLDPFVARTIRDMPAGLISLKLGINVVNADSMRERAFLPALYGFIDTIRDGHPDTPIVMISPIICPAHEEVHGPTLPFGEDGRVTSRRIAGAVALGALHLQRIRKLERRVVAVLRELGDEHLHYLDGLELFGEADLDDLPDGLHPNGAGYQRMGERFHRWAFTDHGPFA